MEQEKIGYTIMSGNPVDGFQLYGFFKDNSEACEVANNDAHLNGDWWVVPVYRVEE